MQNLQNKVALITGAGSGIGAATAKLLAMHGARVAVLGRTANELLAVCNDIAGNGGEAMPVVADIAEPTQMQTAVQKIMTAWDRIDIVFANAGINGVWAPLDELSAEDWDHTLNINLRGTFLTVKSALPALGVRGGAIVITSSVNGTRMFSNSGATAYACSKAAQVAFCKMIALELAERKIRVNVICPGAIKTEISDNTVSRDLDRARVPVKFPEGRIPLTGNEPGTAEEVAELVLFLVSDNARHITGTEVWIDGGQSLLQG
jgi:NAD(P)-dependent dehydrogenase (short-subunit alcohol dehydrogenase family)